MLLALVLLITPRLAEAAASTRIVTRVNAREIVAVRPQGGQPQTLVHLHRGAVLGTAASRGGHILAFASRAFHEVDREHVWTDRIWVLRVGGRPRIVRTIISRGGARGYRSIDSIAISPDGRILLVERRRGDVFTIATDGSDYREVRPSFYDFGVGSGRNSSGPEFTPDGKRIIGVFYPPDAREGEIGGIGTVPSEGGPVHFIRRGPFANGVGHFFGPTVSPDGRFIAFATAGRSGVSIAVMNRDGSGAHRLGESILSGWSIDNPSFSPSGRSLTFVGEHHGMGNVIIGRTPSVVFTIRRDGSRLRIAQTEKARFFSRDPAWVRWQREGGG
ncbi:MAG: TolB protein [Solirubrobacterales bacterium]|nr:TolB protein [Solirubrobacterales bacterium]